MCIQITRKGKLGLGGAGMGVGVGIVYVRVLYVNFPNVGLDVNSLFICNFIYHATCL